MASGWTFAGAFLGAFLLRSLTAFVGFGRGAVVVVGVASLRLWISKDSGTRNEQEYEKYGDQSGELEQKLAEAMAILIAFKAQKLGLPRELL